MKESAPFLPDIVFPSPVEIVDAYEVGDGFHVILKLGSKQVKLQYYQSKNVVETYFSSNSQNARTENETTQLYRFIDSYCQKLSNHLKEPITYYLVAQHPNMQAWAQHRSDTVFSWDNISTRDNGTPVYTKEYVPNN